jgi:hypothetical protein
MHWIEHSYGVSQQGREKIGPRRWNELSEAIETYKKKFNGSKNANSSMKL